MFCNGIFNITTMLTCKIRDIFIFNVKLVWCNQRNNKIVQVFFYSVVFLIIISTSHPLSLFV